VRRPGREIKEAWGQRRVRVSENVSRRIRRRLAASRGVARASRGAEILEKENVSSQQTETDGRFPGEAIFDVSNGGFRATRSYLCRGRGMFRRRRTRTRPDRPSRARPRGGTPCARGATRAESGHWNICDEREEGAPGRVLVTHFEHRSVGAGGAGSSRGSSPSAIDGVGGRVCVPRRGRDGQTRAHHLHRDVCAGASVLRSERRQGKYQRVSGPSIGDVSRSRSRVFSPPSPSTETQTEPRSGFPRHHADARRVLPRVVRSPNPPSREGTGEARPPLRLRASHRPERHVGR
jgi:hypothetical protein